MQATVPLERPARSERWTTLSPRADWLATGWNDGVVTLWETATGRVRTNLPAHQGRIWHMEFSPDQRRLATAGADYTVCLWDLATFESRVLRSVAGNYSVAFSPDGRTLASASDDKTVKQWNFADRREMVTARFDRTVNFLAFAPGGKTLAMVRVDGIVELWEPGVERPAPSKP